MFTLLPTAQTAKGQCWFSYMEVDSSQATKVGAAMLVQPLLMSPILVYRGSLQANLSFSIGATLDIIMRVMEL